MLWSVFKCTFDRDCEGFRGISFSEPLLSCVDSVICSFSSIVWLSYFTGSIPPLCWLLFLVAASDLSAPKKCRARFGLDQQNNWCGPCRCVWCVPALAGARWRLGKTLRWDFLLCSVLLSFLLPSLVCLARLLWPLSFLQPRPAGLSLGFFADLILTSWWGGGGG